MKKIALSLLAALGFASAAQAQDFDRLTVGTGFSSLGATVEFSARVGDSYGVRAPIGYGSFDTSRDVLGARLRGDTRISGGALMGDYFLGENGFRVSAGLMASNFRWQGATRNTFELRGTEYSGRVDAKVTAKRDISPILTIGYDSNITKGWGLSADVGAIFNGGYEAQVSGWQSGGNDAEFQNELQRLQRRIQNDLPDWDVTPYVKMTVIYRF